MIFVTYTFVLMKYFGILADEHLNGFRLRELILFIACSLPMMFILVPNIVYLIVYRNALDVFVSTDLIYTIFMFAGTWNGYLILAIRQIRLRNLINELKTVVANRCSEY